MALIRRTGILALLAVAAMPSLNSGDLPPELVLLSRFKQKVRQQLGALVNCTCLETIERSVRQPGSDTFQFLDRVRLEITTSGPKELLTWPNGARFEDWAVTAFVKSGMVASGMFSSYARNLFLRDAANFHYAGTEDLEGRHTVRYDYRESALASLYKLRSATGAATVATRGSFWFDTATLQLVRLDQYAEDIPDELRLTGSLTRIDYALLPDAAQDVLTPKTALMELTHPSGEIRRNKIQFDRCREYRTESSISFGDTGVTANTNKPAAASVDLPPGLKIKMEIVTGFDSQTVAIGDSLQARVLESVRHRGKVLVPKDATVAGRIRILQRQVPATGFAIGMQWTDLRWAGQSAELHAKMVEIGAPHQSQRTGSRAGRSANVVPLSGAAPDITIEAPEIRITRQSVPGVGLLFVQGEQWRIDPGLQMVWLTIAPSTSREP